MKTSTLRSFLQVHTWVGLIAGLGLFIAFYAGSITVFTEQLHAWEQTETRHAPIESLQQGQALIDAVLAAHPTASERFHLNLPTPHEPRLVLEWDEKRKDGTSLEHHFSLSADGKLQEKNQISELSHFIYRLHYTAGLPASWGLYVLGIVCVLYGLALVSGVVIYAPVMLKSLFALRQGRNLKLFWQDAHNAIGMLSLPFHIIFAWSGAVLAIGTLMLAPFQFLVFDGKLLDIINEDLSLVAPVKASGKSAALISFDDAVARVQAAAPQINIAHMYYHHAGDSNARIEAYGENQQRTLNTMAGVAVDGSTGKILRVQQPENFSIGTGFLRALQTLHFGNYGHVALQWLYFILGLAGAFLFYSGNLLWVEARRKRHQIAQPRNTKWMAQLTLGVCLGCIAGISAVFVTNKFMQLSPQAGDPALWEERSYYAVFFICMIWAFLRAPARAGHELLLLCAALTAAIPVINYAASGEHLLQNLWHGQWVIFSVDTVALIAAYLYWRMAKATLRRGQQGDPNSVWALPQKQTQVQHAEASVTASTAAPKA
ncbi:PepSY domain-containing protein [Undibacterium sp. CY18W]|uniref:PepSY domain-containing protein n=1 Tax=Undibacterium hunanense TaxID=2762292 RepID=A0ABR6ZU31_9BURK|nr:PepSY-associated TM helix domain-containing protein [Undibacterium hunanense]MBC3919385.1 PepSY domain-containing protein [Undibacterium hunanense]